MVAACGREKQREIVVNRLGLKRFTTDFHDIVEANDVDLVIILTSMNEHGAIARAALEAGKHVLVEKPLAVTLQEAQELVELAKTSPGHLICAPFVTLSPTYQTIGRRLARGDIGKVLTARARYGWAGPDWNEWFYQKGGGCLFDLGVYCLSSLTGLMGPAKRVTALAGCAIPERTINGKKIRVQSEDNVQVLLDFGESVFGVVTTGFTIQQSRSPTFELYGSDGTIQMTGDDWAPEGYELWQNQMGAWQIYKETNLDWHWTDGLPHVVDCIHRKVRPLATPDHALHVLEIMLKAQESSREARAINLETTFPPLTFHHQDAAEPAHLVHDRSRQHLDKKEHATG